MASIQGIYIALFGRPADPSGFSYWNGVTSNGSDLSGLVGKLTAAKEYTDRFSGKSNSDIVTSIYQSLFGRAPDADGLKFFVDGLTNGTLKLETIAINILDGAQGSDKALIDGKIAAANLFTSHLDLPGEVSAYSGNAAAQIGRDYITGITKDNPGTGENADAAILKLVAAGGQAPSEGGAPVDGGSSGVGGSPAKTFVITNDGENGVSFSGTATGAITLGHDSEYHLTGIREGVRASVTPEPVSAGSKHAVEITAPVNGDLVINDIQLRASAAAINGHSVTGEGQVDVYGSDNSQSVKVGVDGNTSISLGLGADNLELTHNTGNDSININGVDQELIGNLRSAQSHASEVNGEASALQNAEQEAQNSFDAAKAAFDTAETVLNSVGGADAGQQLVDAKAAADALLSQRVADNASVTEAQASDDTADAAVVRATTNRDTALGVKNTAKAAFDSADAALSAANTQLTTTGQGGGTIGEIKYELRLVTNQHFSSDVNRKKVVDYLEGNLTTKPPKIPADFKDSLIKALPTGNSSFDDSSELNAFINSVDNKANDYKTGLTKAKADAQTTLDQKSTLYVTSEKILAAAVSKATSTQKTLDDAVALRESHSTKTDAELNNDASSAAEKVKVWEAAKVSYDDAKAAIAEDGSLAKAVSDAHSAVESYKDTVTEANTSLDAAIKAIEVKPNDSMIHHEDSIKGFDVGHDALHLPSSEIIHFASGNVEGGFHYEVSSGILRISNEDGKIAINGSNIDTLLNILSDNKVIADGQTIAFEYSLSDADSGLYVFQGHAGASDIGVKLIGLSAEQAGSVSTLLDGHDRT